MSVSPHQRFQRRQGIEQEMWVYLVFQNSQLGFQLTDFQLIVFILKLQFRFTSFYQHIDDKNNSVDRCNIDSPNEPYVFCVESNQIESGRVHHRNQKNHDDGTGQPLPKDSI